VKNWLDKLNCFKLFCSSQNFYEREAINCILSSSVYYLTVFNSLTMTQFTPKHVTQLDTLTVLSNKDNFVETGIDLFIHIMATQRDVTCKNTDSCVFT
jgi:hypothetical protein